MGDIARVAVIISLICRSVLCVPSPHTPGSSIPEDTFLSTPELIQYWGYPAETHQVRTDDGYYLSVHRIPHGRADSPGSADRGNRSRPVMLLVPGLLCESTVFVINLPNQSLGYILADAGYDVWMANTRGTTYSKKHQFYSVDSPEFWDFSWDDMAKYDLPAMVNYILQNTQRQDLYYVGFSQGNLIAFSGLTEQIELQKKIKKFFALAPITRLGGTDHTDLLVDAVPLIRQVLNNIGIHQYLPHNQFWEFVVEVVCPFNLDLCQHFLGGRSDNVNRTRVPLYLMHFPAGTSVKNMEHYAQGVVSKQFKKFDYGLWGNLVWYGSFASPSYDLKKLLVSTVLFSGTNDTVSIPKDVEWVASQLRHVERVVVDGYSHNDFVTGMDAADKVYGKLIEMAD